MNAADVEVFDLEYRYPDATPALRGVTFRVPAGEAVALIGPNGAGKSTLLLHFNGCLWPARGGVRVGGEPVTRSTVARARRAVGLVFQDPDDQLFMPTVLEDVAFGLLNAGMPPEQAERRARETLDRFDLGGLAGRPPYRLSAGEKRTAAIAAVMAMEPSVLALDEPSSHLDPRGRRRLIGLLRSLPQTRIVATHDLELALEVCGRAILLDGGRVVAEGRTRELLSDEVRMQAHGLERPRGMEPPPSASPAVTVRP